MSTGNVTPPRKGPPWPTPAQFNEAVQNLSTCVADEELKGGVAECGSSGMPMPYAGNFADVYKVHCPATRNTWAVKFFKHEVRDLQDRYQAISECLDQAKLPFMVDFLYLDRGVRIQGAWYPIMKMRWIEGQSLNRFVSLTLDEPRRLDQLFQLWVKLSARLRWEGIAHADLQQDNVVLVPHDDQGRLQLKLIDYDGMYVPALANQRSGELGHRNYQHPEREPRKIYNAELDRFPHLVICCALRCLGAGGTPLWEEFNCGENLLFTKDDFLNPAGSAVFHKLWSLQDAEAHALVAQLLLATQRPLEATPLIEDLVREGHVRPLTREEEQQAQVILQVESAPRIAEPVSPVLATPRSGSRAMVVARACQCVGIDLGTTFSSLAYIDQQLSPRMVADSSGQSVIPSAIYFDDAGVIVGDVALQQGSIRAERLVQFVKSHMGDVWKYECLGQKHTPESLSAIILRYLVREAEQQIGSIQKAVITVPAYFTEKRRRATQQAGEIAGLEVIGTLNEPMAATLAHGLHQEELGQSIVVYDLGGGTFDVTVVRISPTEIVELSTNGNRQLGGRDWDQCLIDLVAEDFARAFGADVREHPQALQDLRMECERAKRRLGGVAQTQIRLQALGRDHVSEITREKFERRSAPLLQSTLLTTEMALEDAGLTWRQISQVVLVGGSTNMPAVSKIIEQTAGMLPLMRVNPMFAVALGAAVYGHMLETGRGMATVQQHPPLEFEAESAPPKVQPLASKPISIPPKRPPAPKRAHAPEIPTATAHAHHETGTLNIEDSDDDVMSSHFEAAPVVGPHLAAATAPTISFVTAHGVGVRVRDGDGWRNAVLIPKNARVPATAAKRFQTVSQSGGGSYIRIEVTQGDTPDADLAETLGIGRIVNVGRKEMAGQPVEVQMTFDEFGRLHIEAVYVKTAQAMQMTLDIPGCLRPEEVQHFKEQLERTEILRLYNPEASSASVSALELDE